MPNLKVDVLPYAKIVLIVLISNWKTTNSTTLSHKSNAMF